MADLIIDTDLPSRRHNERINQYIRQVVRLYGVTIDEIAGMARQIELSPDKIFSFDDFPSLKGKSDKVFDKFAKSMLAIVNKATEAEWTKACKEVDTAINKIMQTTRIAKKRLEGYGDRNLKALEAFQSRKIKGMNLSDRVWKYTDQFRQEIELAIDIGIGEGRSAAQLSRDVRQYLNNPDKLFRRVRNKYGNLVLSKTAQSYHPGQGVYRSSYKNARRMTATETNMAYKESDNIRWQQLDFVVGIEIKLSNNHTLNGKPFHDICDTLKGKYPKTFKFTGWHPFCRCYSVPILMTTDEMAETNKMILDGEDISNYHSKNEIVRTPDNFNNWAKENQDKINRAKNKPDFIQDNKKEMDKNLLLAKTEDEIRERKDSEKAVLFDSNGDIILEKGGDKSSVGFKDNEAALFKDNLLTHNHPGGWMFDEKSLGRMGSSFSYDDVHLAIKYDLREIRAVTPLYTFAMKRPSGGWGISIDEFKSAYNDINSGVRKKMTNIIDNSADMQMDINRANALHYHLIWKEFAKKYKIEYSKFKNSPK